MSTARSTRTIKKVTEDLTIEALQYAVARLMELANTLQHAHGRVEMTRRNAGHLLAVRAHMTEELWHRAAARLGPPAAWPRVDEAVARRASPRSSFR